MALDINKMKKQIDDFFNSDKGKESIIKFREKMDKQDAFYKYWVERLKVNLSNKTDEELLVLFEKFHKHSEKRREILWNQRIDGDTSLYPHIKRLFVEVGVGAPEDAYGDFSCSVYDWRGYRCEMYCGQGCFYSLTKI